MMSKLSLVQKWLIDVTAQMCIPRLASEISNLALLLLITRILQYVGILWNRTFGCIEDKLSTTTVVFFRSEGKLKCKHLYGV